MRPQFAFCYLYILCLLFCTPAKALYDSPKHEVRAVWMTTLGGLDWPKNKADTDSGRERQKEELCRLLDRLQAVRINTVLLQTRVRGTTIYPSDYEPWDAALTGKTGRSPGYDPLAFAIEECHKRGMELHAWIVTIPCFSIQGARTLGSKSVLKTHPNLCKRHGSNWYLDPGQPGTADYLTDICREVTSRYDIDGIHFDYIRYPENASSFADGDTYRRYGKGQDKAQWRRDNITRCVRQIYRTVKALKPWVKVSSSPIGKYSDLSRYSSKGWNAYSAVYQDAQGWCYEGIHDMLFPMIYFLGDNFYPFAADWQEHSNGRTVVPGLGIYFMSPREKDWPLEVIERKVNVTRGMGMGGQAYFRSHFLENNVKGLYDFLKERFYPYPALLPPCTWLDSIPPSAPTGLAVKSDEDGTFLTWEAATDNLCGDDVFYNVYMSESLPVDVTQARNLLAVRQRERRFRFNQEYALVNGIYLAVTAMDRFGNESAPVSLETDKPFEGGVLLKHDGITLTVPPCQTPFLILTNAEGRIVRTLKASQHINVSMLVPGYYSIRTLGPKGKSEQIGAFIR